MIQILRVLYTGLIGFLFYRMIKNGGCCGGHGHLRKYEELKDERQNTILTREDKKKAIDLE